MARNAARFESTHRGMRWSEIAKYGNLRAVLYPWGSERENLLMHAQSQFGARIARRWRPEKGILLDFGCGTGRMLRFFGQRGWSAVGTEITPGMLAEAQKLGLPKQTQLCLTDGVSIPLRDQSVDMIWVSGVLKYSLFEPNSVCRGGGEIAKRDGAASAATSSAESQEPFVPAYRDIAMEMYRVLKPGSLVVNVEMYVDAKPDVFTADFEQVGFKTERVRVLRRYNGYMERFLQFRSWHRLPPKLVLAAGESCAALRYMFDNPSRTSGGFRDYLFVWAKPK
jgi:SAM-dependent methyltransferase